MSGSRGPSGGTVDPTPFCDLSKIARYFQKFATQGPSVVVRPFWACGTARPDPTGSPQHALQQRTPCRCAECTLEGRVHDGWHRARSGEGGRAPAQAPTPRRRRAAELIAERMDTARPDVELPPPAVAFPVRDSTRQTAPGIPAMRHRDAARDHPLVAARGPLSSSSTMVPPPPPLPLTCGAPFGARDRTSNTTGRFTRCAPASGAWPTPKGGAWCAGSAFARRRRDPRRTKAACVPAELVVISTPGREEAFDADCR